MDSDILRPPNTPVKPRTTTKLLLVFGIAIVLLAGRSLAATFSGNARVEVADSTGGLSWNGSALSVACWFKISIPSGTNLTENMTILVNRRTGNDSSAYAYLMQFNISSGVRLEVAVSFY